MSFWVVPPPENRIMEYGRPMLMTYSVNQDNELSDEVMSEMSACIDYYKRFPQDMVNFSALYTEETTYIEKLKVTLYSKFPRKQNDHEFWNWLRDRLDLEKESEFTPPKWITKSTNKQQQLQQQIQQLDDDQKDVVIVGSSENGSVHIDLTSTPNNKHDPNNTHHSKISKDDKLLIRSLQEQLSLPSGLNMNPSPISSTLLLPNVANSMSSNNSIHTTSSSPRDSPITIPSNSASPAKFEVPIRASPSPAKSDTSSTKTRNSPAPSPNKYASLVTDLTRSSPSLTISAAHHQPPPPLPLPPHHKYDLSGIGTSITPTTSSASSSHYQPQLSQQNQQQQSQQQQLQQQQQQQQQQLQLHQQQLNDFYASANFASLAKDIANYSPSDYAMLFNNKDYSQLAGSSLAAINGLSASNLAGINLGSLNVTASSSNDRNDRSERSERNERNDRNDRNDRSDRSDRNDRNDRNNDRNDRSSSVGSNASSLNNATSMMGNSGGNLLSNAMSVSVSGSNNNTTSNERSGKQSSASSSTSTTPSFAAAMAGSMKEFLAQLEKSTELSYLMQSQYSFPQMMANVGGGGSSSSKHGGSDYGSSKKHEKKSSSSRMTAAQQQQRQFEEEYKKDANKINEFMRSQEYTSMLLEQAEALSASGYGQMPEPPPTKKSKKSQSQAHHNNTSAAAVAAAASSSLSDLTSLLQASPKIHELNSLFQSGKTADLQALLQQQFAGLPSTSLSASSSHLTKKQQQQQLQQQQQQQHHQQQLQQQQLQDYSALFSHPKMADLTSLMSGAAQSHASHHNTTPSAAELSALFSTALAGKSAADKSAISASVDMLGSLLQQSGGKASADLSSLLFSQANAAELNNLFAQSSPSASAASKASAAASSSAAAAAYYTQAALDKAQADMAALYQQHNKYASIPDPLSKSTLAANNMFMNPSTIYAKMQQEALNAMIMKPPKVSSASSTTSSSKSREASASPAALDKSHKSNANRDSPASLNNMKYNFSAVDLAISSVPNAMSSPLIGGSDLSVAARKMSDSSPLLDMSMIGGGDVSQLESRLKKRMEFSSIADLVAPPSKMQKLEELAQMHQQQTAQQQHQDSHNDSNSSALNLSAND